MLVNFFLIFFYLAYLLMKKKIIGHWQDNDHGHAVNLTWLTVTNFTFHGHFLPTSIKIYFNFPWMASTKKTWSWQDFTNQTKRYPCMERQRKMVFASLLPILGLKLNLQYLVSPCFLVRHLPKYLFARFMGSYPGTAPGYVNRNRLLNFFWSF